MLMFNRTPNFRVETALYHIEVQAIGIYLLQLLLAWFSKLTLPSTASLHQNREITTNPVGKN
jgi:hypothetical protein